MLGCAGIPPEFQELRVSVRPGEELTLNDSAEVGFHKENKSGQGLYLRLHTERLQVGWQPFVLLRVKCPQCANLWPASLEVALGSITA